MPVPQLTPSGLLPPGIYDCTLADIREAFGSPTTTPRRQEIHSALLAAVADPLLDDLVDHILIDGSYVTSNPQPHDVDVIFALRPLAFARLGPAANRGIPWALSAIRVLAGRTSPIIEGRHAVHGFPLPMRSQVYQTFLDWFQRERDGVTVKGILRVGIK